MAIDFKTLLQVAPHVLSGRKPLLLRGRHGIGKSEVVYQIAAELGLPVVERRASQMTEGDLLGLPSLKSGVTTQIFSATRRGVGRLTLTQGCLSSFFVMYLRALQCINA